MNKIVMTFTMSLLSLNAGNLCDIKTKIIEQKISIAKQSNLKYTKEKLTIALNNHLKYCNDKDIIENQQKTINKLKDKLEDKEYDLQKAKFKGKDMDKISKLEQKVLDIKRELNLEISILELLKKEVNENNSKQL
ncbi:DUF1090 family protein [Helicobacter ibis]|uniref:DUF1090 family protein n=1 Tax=Helicobacter ibis TaxID=2962633 RepID=A0ABT4VFG9_9HELI|nr:DUF1090 family protein [Helicobacter ibis]MDA3969463.1 DUF1090 family protein [Helicobacter ibis]